MIPKPINHFEVEGYEVRFLQDAPVTVCVIRSLTDRSQKYTGISVCHPSDVWDEAVGRHKAMKETLNDSKSFGLCAPIVRLSSSSATMLFAANATYILPVKEIQRAYWEHYKE